MSHLEMINDPEGRISFEKVIEDARREDSPLHSCFTWDDRDAAHERRLDQAQYLLNAIGREVVDEADGATILELANVTIVDPDTGGRYAVSPEFAAREPVFRGQVADQAIHHLREAIDRLRILGSMERPVAAIAEIIAEAKEAKNKPPPPKGKGSVK